MLATAPAHQPRFPLQRPHLLCQVRPQAQRRDRPPPRRLQEGGHGFEKCTGPLRTLFASRDAPRSEHPSFPPNVCGRRETPSARTRLRASLRAAQQSRLPSEHRDAPGVVPAAVVIGIMGKCLAQRASAQAAEDSRASVSGAEPAAFSPCARAAGLVSLLTP